MNSTTDERFTAYSGTTVENYRTCTAFTENGIIFEKRAQPQHYFKEFFYLRGLAGTWKHAFSLARGLNHVPLVLVTRLPIKYVGETEVPPSEVIKVESVWVPAPGIDWRTLNPFTDISGQIVELPPETLITRKRE